MKVIVVGNGVAGKVALTEALAKCSDSVLVIEGSDDPEKPVILPNRPVKIELEPSGCSMFIPEKKLSFRSQYEKRNKPPWN